MVVGCHVRECMLRIIDGMLLVITVQLAFSS